jgi:hypothetical protein
MLDARDDVLLHRDDGLVKQNAGEIGIVGKTLPVATSTDDSSETAAYRSESYVGAFTLEFSSQVVFRFVD